MSIFNIKINKIIKYLIWSDVAFWSGWGLVSPIFAVFIVEKIQGGTVTVVGISTAVYWILKSLLRIPIGMFLDTHDGEEDDFWFLFFGLVLSALVPFGFLMAYLPWHLYFLQAIFAVAGAMTFSGWQAIFTRHIDKGKEATDWGVDATLVGLGIGVAGGLGGFMVAKFGFNFIFVLVGLLGLLAAILPLFILKLISSRKLQRGVIFSLKEIFQKESK